MWVSRLQFGHVGSDVKLSFVFFRDSEVEVKPQAARQDQLFPCVAEAPSASNQSPPLLNIRLCWSPKIEIELQEFVLVLEVVHASKIIL